VDPPWARCSILEAESIQSLTPLLQQADQWAEVLVLLPLLVALEIVLSADNAIALAAIARSLDDPASQRQALNLGLALALVFRLGLIVAAQWVLNFWPLQVLAAGYLFWLCGSHLIKVSASSPAEVSAPEDGIAPADLSPMAEREPGPDGISNPAPGVLVGGVKGLSSVVITLALTDLAFSLDSVAAAVAVTDRLVLVMAGGVVGVVALRLTAELFIRWLEQYQHLETAGYLAVGFVGFRLLLRLFVPDFDLPEWSLLLLVAVLFAWGFSKRNPLEAAELPGSARS
jgi:YkoY family integral membrane protein